MNKQLKENPWEKLTEGEVKIAKCDRAFFEEWAKKNHIEGKTAEIVKAYAEEINAKTWIDKETGETKNVELTFDCLPDPFSGNPGSKVYCLNMNPGKPDAKFKGIDAYTKATEKNLRLESENCFWAKGILNAEESEHAGADWTCKRTKEIKEILNEGNSGKELIPDIFFIEYFPYHSTSGFGFPKKRLMEKVSAKNANGKKEVVKDDKGNIEWQHREKKSEENSYPVSYDFSDELIRLAMDDNNKKMIIIMREKDRWLERIEGLADYEHLYVLSSPQCGYLTLRNIKNYKTGKRLEDEENYKEIIKKYFKI